MGVGTSYPLTYHLNMIGANLPSFPPPHLIQPHIKENSENNCVTPPPVLGGKSKINYSLWKNEKSRNENNGTFPSFKLPSQPKSGKSTVIFNADAFSSLVLFQFDISAQSAGYCSNCCQNMQSTASQQQKYYYIQVGGYCVSANVSVYSRSRQCNKHTDNI